MIDRRAGGEVKVRARGGRSVAAMSQSTVGPSPRGGFGGAASGRESLGRLKPARVMPERTMRVLVRLGAPNVCS